jgi:uncharacterized membrane protein
MDACYTAIKQRQFRFISYYVTLCAAEDDCMRDEFRLGQPISREGSDVASKTTNTISGNSDTAQVGNGPFLWLSAASAQEWYLCGGLTLIGAVARYALLYTQSLTIDEGSSLIFAYAPADQLISNVIHYDTHPPLYYLSVHYGYYLLGLSPIDALRVPSFIAGTLSVAVMYAIARLLMGRVAAVAASLLTICAPIAVWYSHDGRMYALTWLLVLLAYLALVHIRQRRGWFWIAVYGLAVALALYADVSSWLAIFPQVILIGGGLISAYLAGRTSGAPWASERLRAWARASVVFLVGWLLYVPWLVAFPEQLALIRSVQFGVPSLQVYWLLLRNDLGLTASYALLSATVPLGVDIAMLVAFSLAALTLVWAAGDSRYRLYCGLTAALTIGVAGVFGLTVLGGSRAVLIPRVVGIGAFGFVLLGAGAIGVLADATLPLNTWSGAADNVRMTPRFAYLAARALAALLTLTLVTGMAAALVQVGTNGDNGSGWNTLAAQIVRQAGPNDVVMYYPLGIKSVIDPYLPTSSPWREVARGLWPVTGVSPRPYFQRYLPDHARVWFLFYSSSQITMPVYDGWIQGMGYCRSQGDPAAPYGMVVYTQCSRSYAAALGSIFAFAPPHLASFACTRSIADLSSVRLSSLR